MGEVSLKSTLNQILKEYYDANFITFPVRPVGHKFYDATEYQEGGGKRNQVGKAPAISSWQDSDLEDPDEEGVLDKFLYINNNGEQAMMNIGVALQAHQIVIDVDIATKNKPNKKGLESFKQLQEDMQIPLDKYCQLYAKTGSGGRHYFFSKDPNVATRKTISTWICCSEKYVFMVSNLRPTALTIPLVTVWPTPKGFPMATT